jgi:hypothetical protein
MAAFVSACYKCNSEKIRLYNQTFAEKESNVCRKRINRLQKIKGI